MLTLVGVGGGERVAGGAFELQAGRGGEVSSDVGGGAEEKLG